METGYHQPLLIPSPIVPFSFFYQVIERSRVEKRYSLHGFMIVESEKGLRWIQHVGDWNNTGEMVYIAGAAYIHRDFDVLLLGKCRSMSVDEEMKTFDEVETYLDSLPKWDKTKYYVKLADIELSSLIDCETGDEVYSEVNPDILSSLHLLDRKIWNDDAFA